MNRFTSILLLVFVFISCERSTENKITIAATTDVHGVIFANDPATGVERDYSMSKVDGYLKKFDRKELLLLDNGDNIQGTPAVYYYNFEDTTTTHLWSRLLNFMGYNAVTVGNHDIEAGHRVYDKIRSQFNGPMLAANAINSSNGEPYFEPYTLVRKGGLKIAVIGLITPGVPGWLPEVLYEGIEFEDMVESARKWMPEILSEEPDLVVGLFHSGWNETYGGGSEGSYLNENASLSVAREVEGFDLIFIGHDHDLMNDYMITNAGDSVLILDGGSHARFISLAEISYSGGRNPEIIRINGRHVKTDTLSPSKDFEDAFSKDYTNVSEYINRPIGLLSSPLSSRSSYFGDSEFIDLIHLVQLETSGADISFAAPLSFDVQIDSGMLTVADMFDLYRYENMLYTIELSGREVDAYLEFSAGLWYNTFENSESSILKYLPGNNTRLANRYYNFDSAAGIEYTVDLRKEEGDRVDIQGFSDGRGFSFDERYKVAVNSYRGNGGGGHLSRGCGLSEEEISKRLLSSTDKDLRYHMMKWIENKEIINIESDNNWRLLPERDVRAAIDREVVSLFNR